MSPIVQYAQILALVGGVVDLALRVVAAIRDGGGCVDGCPDHVEADILARAREPIPAEDERMGRAANEARRRVAGLDRARLDADEVLSAGANRIATTEHPDAGEVYGDDDDGA